MIHGGEGDAGTGEVNRRPGRFHSLCCGREAEVRGGEPFPACPRCGQPADWSWAGPLAPGGDPGSVSALAGR